MATHTVDTIVYTADDDYAKSYEATIQAGYLVRKMMATLGYEKSGRQGSWSGGVAKTGEIYLRMK